MRAFGFTLVAGAALASLGFVRVLQPTTPAMTAFLSAWLVLPYAVLAVILTLSKKERPAAPVMVAALVATGGLLFLTAVIFVYPDPQGSIGVLFTPIYQLVAIAVLLPLTQWVVKRAGGHT